MALKKMILLVSGLVLVGCGSGGGGNTTPPSPPVGGSPVGDGGIRGDDLSGTYREVAISCIDPVKWEITATGTPNSSSSVSTTYIDGNKMTSISWGKNSCRVASESSFEAYFSKGSKEAGEGLLYLGSTKNTVTNGSPCKLETNYSMDYGKINPTSFYVNIFDGQIDPRKSANFLMSENYLYISSLIQVVGRPADICLIVLKKM